MDKVKELVQQKLKEHKDQVQTLYQGLTQLQEQIKKSLALKEKTQEMALNASAVLLLQQNIKRHEGAIEAYNLVLKELN